jgi:hypothetical protein
MYKPTPDLNRRGNLILRTQISVHLNSAHIFELLIMSTIPNSVYFRMFITKDYDLC